MGGPACMPEEEFTYDALRRVERQENTSPRLTKLESRFWERLGEHLERLRDEFQRQQEEDPTARRTVVLADELRNTQRLAESIWSLREKKVVQAAMGAVRRREGKASVPDHATGEERDLFVSVMEVMVSARDGAAITDPFSKRRRERLSREAGARKGAQGHGGEQVSGAARSGSGGPSSTSTGTGSPTVPGAHREAPPGVAAQEGAGEGPKVIGGIRSGEKGHSEERVGEPGVPGRGAGGGRSGGVGQEGPQDSGGGLGQKAGGGIGGIGGTGEKGAGEEEGGQEGSPQAQALEGGTGVGGAGGQEVELRLVEALRDVPLFAGPDLATYELGKGEVGNLPAKAALILEQRGLVRVLPQE